MLNYYALSSKHLGIQNVSPEPLDLDDVWVELTTD